MKTTTVVITAVIGTLALAIGAWGLRPHARQSIFEHLQETPQLAMTIESDWSAMLKDKAADVSQDARVTYTTADGKAYSWQAKVKTRGKTRREICDFPPLKLRFEEEDLKAKGMVPSFNSLKLVTQCNTDEQLLLKEYLAYRLYNHMTNHSFKVHLARVTYRDAEGKVAPFEQYALILENADEMAARLSGHLLENEETSLSKVDAEQYRLLTVFQYMIGNTDWNMSKHHNIKLLQLKDKMAPTPVPYDFDYAGLVNAPYAKPHPQLPIQSVTQRLFQWRGQNATALEHTLAQFKCKKNALLKEVRQLEGLRPEVRTEALTYLETFFELLERKELKGEAIVNVFNTEGKVS